MSTALPRAWRQLHTDERRCARSTGRIRSLVRKNGALPPHVAAKVAGLHYVNDVRTPGIRRLGAARRFRYIAPNGRPVKDPAQLRRIKALAIPPAWTDVWICPDADGHLQATGRDARGRKQYRYHPRWREVRDEVKYGRLIAFAQTLPRIRARVEADVRRRGLPREKVLAAFNTSREAKRKIASAVEQVASRRDHRDGDGARVETCAPERGARPGGTRRRRID